MLASLLVNLAQGTPDNMALKWINQLTPKKAGCRGSTQLGHSIGDPDIGNWSRSPDDRHWGAKRTVMCCVANVTFPRQSGTAAHGLKSWKADDPGNAQPCQLSGFLVRNLPFRTRPESGHRACCLLCASFRSLRPRARRLNRGRSRKFSCACQKFDLAVATIDERILRNYRTR